MANIARREPLSAEDGQALNQMIASLQSLASSEPEALPPEILQHIGLMQQSIISGVPISSSMRHSLIAYARWIANEEAQDMAAEHDAETNGAIYADVKQNLEEKSGEDKQGWFAKTFLGNDEVGGWDVSGDNSGELWDDRFEEGESPLIPDLWNNSVEVDELLRPGDEGAEGRDGQQGQDGEVEGRDGQEGEPPAPSTAQQGPEGETPPEHTNEDAPSPSSHAAVEAQPADAPSPSSHAAVEPQTAEALGHITTPMDRALALAQQGGIRCEGVRCEDVSEVSGPPYVASIRPPSQGQSASVS
jgi:hypothetical protein